MKKVLVFVVALGIMAFSFGCESMNKTTKGAIAGGVIGAGAGGIIGHQSGNGGAGAAIGAAVGAIGGGFIGNQMDKKDQPNPNYLSVPQVVEMAQKGTPDDIIIDEIHRTKSVYTSMTSEVIAYLKQNKVSDKVIDAMLATNKK